VNAARLAQVSSKEAVEMARRLALEEGLLVGISSVCAGPTRVVMPKKLYFHGFQDYCASSTQYHGNVLGAELSKPGTGGHLLLSMAAFLCWHLGRGWG
jgi:hypothetical protein